MYIFYLSLTILHILTGSTQGSKLETENDEVTLTTTENLLPTWPIPSSSLQTFDPDKNLKTTESDATAEDTGKQDNKNSTMISSLNYTDNVTEEFENTNIPFETDLVSLIRGPANRRSGTEKKFEWSWDRWCQLQPKIGDCQQELTFYYYQVQSDTCREFTYTGCNGNLNRFPSLMACERFCKGYGTEMETKSLKEAEACSLQPDPGNCLALMPRYYYDVNIGRCRDFVFGGCGGNANRFVTEDECNEKCGTLFQSAP